MHRLMDYREKLLRIASMLLISIVLLMLTYVSVSLGASSEDKRGEGLPLVVSVREIAGTIPIYYDNFVDGTPRYLQVVFNNKMRGYITVTLDITGGSPPIDFSISGFPGEISRSLRITETPVTLPVSHHIPITLSGEYTVAYAARDSKNQEDMIIVT